MVDKKALEGLRDFATTDRQREVLEAYLRSGTETKAAKLLGISRSTVNESIRNLKRKAAIQGYAPKYDMTRPTSDTHVVKGTSTLYDSDGNISLQWVKTDLKRDQLVQVMREVVDELKSDVKPVKPTKLTNERQLAELLNLYVLTDAHLGLLSWGEETGDNWDLEIAEETILKAVGHLTATSPDAKHGFFLQLGDGLHSDGLLPVTPTSGHVLDADGRFQKIVRTAIRVFRQCITSLLQKHERVTVLMAQGNHDLASSVWLQEMFSVLFAEDPRVEIIVSPNPYYAYTHGRVLLGAHHGHKKSNLRDLSNTFVNEFRTMFGNTDRTYIHTGHLHHDESSGNGTTIVERHETLAARDAHAAHGGYTSGRSMKCITYDKKAEISRAIFHV